MRRLTVRDERFAVAGEFRIARGTKAEAHVVLVSLAEAGAVGRGECVPYGRYGESVDSVTAQIEALRPGLEAGLTRTDLQAALPAGAARNAVDCALWDLEAKLTGEPVWRLAGLPPPQPVTTCFTLSLEAPEVMAAAAKAHAERPVLKVKLGGGDGLDVARLDAIAAVRPDASLILDGNEALSLEAYSDLLRRARKAGVVLIEQPFPAGKEKPLLKITGAAAVCADESLHVARDLDKMSHYFDAVNVKLDKTGGLTEAIATVRYAKDLGLQVMIGCMLASSLAMAPAMLLTPYADYVDLDGPLLLAEDRTPPILYDCGVMHPPARELWG